MGWLYALHIRSSLARDRRWQAVHMLDGLRNQVVALACLRFGLPHHQGRGVYDLPPEETELLADTLVVSLERPTSGGPSRVCLACSLRRRAASTPGWPPGRGRRSKG